jgi:hypothetical protein
MNQNGVDFDGRDAVRSLEQWRGQGAPAGTDFDNSVGRVLGAGG